MTRKEARRQELMFSALEQVGINRSDAEKLRRISLTLHCWYELECSTNNGAIERDEATGKPFWRYCRFSGPDHLVPTPDRETGALRRLAKIFESYPNLSYYVQEDPRGAALWVLRPGDVLEGHSADSCYSRGIAVY